LKAQKNFSKGYSVLFGYNYHRENDQRYFDNIATYLQQYTWIPSEASRHRMTFAATWEVPFGKGRQYLSTAPRAVDAILGGWNVTPTAFWRSGRYIRFGALAVNGDPSRVGDALTCARRLSRKHSRWARAVSLLIRAGVESIRQQPPAAVDLLERAEREFEAADMAHYVAACRYRRGSLIGQDQGRALVSAAETWATAQAVANPQKIFDMLAPGLWTSSSPAPKHPKT